jgi:hypothetical protein
VSLTAEERTDDREPAARTGLRRVGWVRLVEGPTDIRAEVVGVGHRSPTARPITLGTAHALMSSGVPVVCIREGTTA